LWNLPARSHRKRREAKAKKLGRGEDGDAPSIVGSYSSTKWLWMSWMVKQDLPTPPPPTTTSLYSRRNCRGEALMLAFHSQVVFQEAQLVGKRKRAPFRQIRKHRQK